MPSRAEHDWNAAFTEEIIGAQHIVAVLYLMVDVLDAGLRCTHKRDSVVDRVDAHQRDVADGVGDARGEDLGPDAVLARGIGGIDAGTADTGEPAVTEGK